MFKHQGRNSSKSASERRILPWSGRVTTVVLAGAITLGVLAGGLAYATGAVGAGVPSAATLSSGSPNALVPVIVRESADSAAGSRRILASLAGHVTLELGIINGYAALVPQEAIESLRAADGVASVTLDREVQLNSKWKSGSPGWKADTGYSTLGDVTRLIGAQKLWNTGITGKGVGIALIDSGTVPVQGLAGRVVSGPDLSFESQLPARVNLDSFGHGTHLAGIMAGRDPAAVSTKALTDPSNFVGVAPGAKVISVKVAASDGATDVSQILAAIDWVVQHRDDPGLNIRVLNLSFGTDSTQDYRVDPLAYAVEVAWRHGIVVVVAGGNNGSSGRLNDPAFDPYVIAVGAEDMSSTPGAGDDIVPDWSSRGSSTRGVDVVAPGKSILSLRDPGSWADVNFPDAAVNGRFFRGSGTSQATAVVSGAVALLLSQRPGLTPDQVKYALMATAKQLPAADELGQGAGLIDVSRAATQRVPHGAATQSYPLSTGYGSLEGARGSVHVADADTELAGEIDIFGEAWDGRSWSGRSWSGTSWQGDLWMGRSWSGTWQSGTWAGRSWSGRSWSDNVWDGRSWSGRSWSADAWSGRSWSGRSWSDVWAQ
jgi:serine protease AprX